MFSVFLEYRHLTLYLVNYIWHFNPLLNLISFIFQSFCAQSMYFPLLFFKYFFYQINSYPLVDMDDFFDSFEPVPTNTQPNQESQFHGFQGEEVYQGVQERNPNANIPLQYENFYQPPVATFQQNMNEYESNNQQYNNDADQEIDTIQKQQLEIEYKLRTKADEEFKLKKARKENGAKILRQFLEQREQQQIKTRQLNHQKQVELIQKSKDRNIKTSWAKIADNIALKQGEYPGTKDVTRMKEAIINKMSDERKN